MLALCNLVNNTYQQDSRTLNTIIPNKLFRQLLELSSPKIFKHISFRVFVY